MPDPSHFDFLSWDSEWQRLLELSTTFVYDSSKDFDLDRYVVEHFGSLEECIDCHDYLKAEYPKYIFGAYREDDGWFVLVRTGKNKPVSSKVMERLQDDGGWDVDD